MLQGTPERSPAYGWRVAAGDGGRAAPPKAPVLPDAPSAAVDLDDLDELYPDIDGLDAEGLTLELPEARKLDLLRSRLRGCELDVPADCTIKTRDSVLDGIDLVGRRLTGLVRTHLVRCRLTGADLTSVTDVAALAGTTISPAQSVALAARMAHGLGVRVRDPGDDARAFPALGDRK